MSTVANRYLEAAASTRRRWDLRYAEGFTPWDTQVTPPEVEAFWHSGRLAPVGLAVDLGCGPGTNVRFLARLGLTAVGVEIAGAPLRTAQLRLQSESKAVQGRVGLVCADVSALPFHRVNAQYILDVGCLHSLPREVRGLYAAGVVANLAPGSYYQVYAFDERIEPAEEGSDGPSGMAPGEVVSLFGSALHLVEEVEARPDRRPCRWYLLRKPEAPETA